MRDLIFMSMEPWDAHWRRNQFVCAEFSRRHPGRKILFVTPPRDMSNRMRTGRMFSGDRQPSTWRVPELNITVTSPLKLFPNSLVAGRKMNEFQARVHVRKVARQMGIDDPVLWLNPHSAEHMVGRMGESAVIYDITDDWTTLTQSARLTALIRRQDAALCRKADATIVCSERLLEMKRSVTANLHLIPNGVDAAHYAGIAERLVDPLEVTRSWPRPVFGYTGTIHPDRVDVDLVCALAKPGMGSVALIGPDYLSPQDNARLASLGNVFLTGAVPYSRIPAYMSAFGVCITPHRMTPFTESLNPIKLWEYLAAGLPIVSTDVAGFRDYPQFVNLARTPAEFIAATRAALSEGRAKSETRRAEAARHSWASRVDQIEAVIESCLRRRAARDRGGVVAVDEKGAAGVA